MGWATIIMAVNLAIMAQEEGASKDLELTIAMILMGVLLLVSFLFLSSPTKPDFVVPLIILWAFVSCYLQSHCFHYVAKLLLLTHHFVLSFVSCTVDWNRFSTPQWRRNITTKVWVSNYFSLLQYSLCICSIGWNYSSSKGITEDLPPTLYHTSIE